MIDQVTLESFPEDEVRDRIRQIIQAELVGSWKSTIGL